MNADELNLLGQKRTSKRYKRSISTKLFFFLRGHYATLLDFIQSRFTEVEKNLDICKEDVNACKKALDTHKQAIDTYKQDLDAYKVDLLAIASRLSTIESKTHKTSNTLGVTEFPAARQ